MDAIKKIILIFFCFFLIYKTSLAQTNNAAFQELAPFAGFYAPDRFQTSLSFGVRYYYKIDARFGVGAVLGIAKAKQDYLKKINTFAPDLGSDRVLFYGLRVTNSFSLQAAIPYLIFQLGLTQLHSESNLTFSLGLGTKIYTTRNFTIRYEFLDHIFTSGKNESAWTNNNLEFAIAIGFLL